MKTQEMANESKASFFDRQERIEWWNQQKLSDSRVLIVGAGALGNEVIKNLSLIGVGHMFIVDFDTVDDTNLSRSVLFRSEDSRTGASKAYIAASRAKDLNPKKDATVNYLNGNAAWDLGTGVYRHSDVIVGCLDNIEARLSVNLNSWRTGKAWIDGGMWELAGSVSVYDSDPSKACYECGMTPDHYRLANQRYSCTNAVVKAKIKEGFEPTTQTTSAIIGAIQSQEVIKILHKLPSFSGRRLMFSGNSRFYIEDNNPTYMIDLTQNPDCLCHHEPKYPEINEISEAKSETKLADFLKLLHSQFGEEPFTIDLGRVFVISATCPYCGRITHVGRPKYKVLDTQIVCLTCEVICPTCGFKNIGSPDCKNCGQQDIYEPRLDTFHEISETSNQLSEFQEFRLSDFGIPALQVLRVIQGEHEYCIELSGDIPLIWE
jgi:molybdopterin/thiamine biosynthesis adenylyltransferase